MRFLTLSPALSLLVAAWHRGRGSTYFISSPLLDLFRCAWVCVRHPVRRFLSPSAYELNPAELREMLQDLVAASLDKGVVS